MELLIIAGVISLFAGPTALKKIMQMAQELNQVKSNLTGPGALKHLLGPETEAEVEADTIEASANADVRREP